MTLAWYRSFNGNRNYRAALTMRTVPLMFRDVVIQMEIILSGNFRQCFSACSSVILGASCDPVKPMVERSNSKYLLERKLFVLTGLRKSETGIAPVSLRQEKPRWTAYYCPASHCLDRRHGKTSCLKAFDRAEWREWTARCHWMGKMQLTDDGTVVITVNILTKDKP